MGVLRLHIAFVLMLLVYALAGCSGNNSSAPSPVADESAVAGGWPAFPGDSQPGSYSRTHHASGAVSVFGLDYTLQSGLNNYADTLVPNAYVIVPGSGTSDVAWARYTVPDLDTQRPVSVDLTVSAAPLAPGGADNLPLSYFVGVSDFTSFTWQWYGPYTQAQNSITLNAQDGDVRDRCVGSAAAHNALHLVVVTVAGEEFASLDNPGGLTAARIEQFTVNTLDVGDAGYAATRPHYAALDSIGNGSDKGPSALDPATQYVVLDWTHLVDLSGAELDADSYDVYRQGPGDAAALPIGAVAAPGATYTDPTDNEPGVPEPQPGATYIYCLRAVNGAGPTPFDAREYTVPLLAPANVSASDGTYIDKVALAWTKAEGATGYKVYRDGQTESDVIATLGDVEAYDDTGLADPSTHTYWLRSTNDFLPQGGAWSAAEAGNCSIPPVADLQVDPASGYEGLLALLDAGASYDPDPSGAIVKYEFDFGEGGGWVDFGALSSATHQYLTAGTYTLQVRVADMSGATGEASFVLHVYLHGGAEQMITVPRVYGRNQVPPPYLQIFKPDPKLRRDGRLMIDTFNGVVTPTDQFAWADVLKTSGMEFSVNIVQVDVGGHPVFVPYPVVVVKETLSPDDITGPDDPGAIPDVSIPLAGGRESGRIVVDITALILGLPPAVPGDTLHYSYKLFKSDGSDEGAGQFDVPPDPIDPLLPVGVDWGINVGNRGDWNLNDFNSEALSKAVNGATMTGTTPDMLWVRFNGCTRMLDWSSYWGGSASNNVSLIIEDADSYAAQPLPLCLVAAGVTANGDYIAVHHLNRNDGAGYYYDWASAIPGAGVLIPGHQYNIYLDDVTSGGFDWQFPDQLTVIGTNPNFT